MLDKSKSNVVYLEGGEDDEALPVESAKFSVYSDERGDWLLILVRCPDYRSIEIGIPLPAKHALKAGDVLRGVAYDESKGGWLTNMYYYSHFGIEDVIVTVGRVGPESGTFSVCGSISNGAPGDLETVAFTIAASRDDQLRKSFA